MASGGGRVVEAAGCLVWRSGRDGVIEVLLVHRPAPHDDWSLPKGKLDRGESHLEAAVREVREETGVSGHLGEHLAEVRYDLPSGVHKHVRFWALEAVVERPRKPDDEIDALRWVPLERTAAELTWQSDRVVVSTFVERMIREGRIPLPPGVD
jgi:8-oxo-dGTP pyrophosphatase MutT (NUDIX family)